MTIIQELIATIVAFVAINSILIGVLIKYLDAKIDPIKQSVDMLVQYMVSHEGRLSTLEERTKSKG